MNTYDTYGKNELFIRPIRLEHANLNAVADAVAGVLKLKRSSVLVTDALGDQLVLDILTHSPEAGDFVGKQGELLDALSRVPGVAVLAETEVTSRGMLGWIQADEEAGREALQQSQEIALRVREAIGRRVLVYSTGAELASRQVLDTNGGTIAEVLGGQGYAVTLGPTLRDDDVAIATALRSGVDQGFGLVITTGGVGAEDKDRSVEAVMRVDPEAETPTLVKYQLGVGRHQHKDSVRIAVGELDGARVVALPGPNDEVRVALEPLLAGLARDAGKQEIADALARELRTCLRAKMGSGAPHAGRVTG